MTEESGTSMQTEQSGTAKAPEQSGDVTSPEQGEGSVNLVNSGLIGIWDAAAATREAAEASVEQGETSADGSGTGSQALVNAMETTVESVNATETTADPAASTEAPTEAPTEPPTEAPTEPPVPQSRAAALACSAWTSQILMVEATGSYCQISLHEKNAEGNWEAIFDVPGFVGTGGVTDTTEWNGGTPPGIFTPGVIFGNAPDPGCPLGYIQTDDTYYWVDDVDSPYYNRMVSTSWEGIDGTEWNSAEHIASAGPCYDYLMDIGYNPDCIPGVGSAIFVHVTTGLPSRGCIGVPREEMITLLQRARPDLLIVIGNTEGAYCIWDY